MPWYRNIQNLKYMKRQMFFTKLYFFTFRLLDFLYFKTCFLFLQIYFETMRSEKDCPQTVRQPLVWDIPPQRDYFRNWSQRPAEIKKIALLKNYKRESLISASPIFKTYLHCFWLNKFLKEIIEGSVRKLDAVLH